VEKSFLCKDFPQLIFFFHKKKVSRDGKPLVLDFISLTLRFPERGTTSHLFLVGCLEVRRSDRFTMTFSGMIPTGSF